jgi:DNA-binding MarR family transcriptional regulator
MGGPMCGSELAERLEITSPGALKIVDEMQDTGYLERVADAEDGRAKRLRLTQKGKAALAQARRFHRRFERGLASGLGARRAGMCRAVLEVIVERRELSGTPTALRPV